MDLLKVHMILILILTVLQMLQILLLSLVLVGRKEFNQGILLLIKIPQGIII